MPGVKSQAQVRTLNSYNVIPNAQIETIVNIRANAHISTNTSFIFFYYLVKELLLYNTMR